MKIIRLSRGQVKWSAVNNPIFDFIRVRTDTENSTLVSAFAITRSEELRAELIFSNLHLVQHTVGRYLANWPETKRWKDDMVSVGVETLIKQIDKIDGAFPDRFRGKTVLHIKSQIEMHLNDIRTAVSASLSTNYRRLRDGKPMASIPDVSLDQILENK